MIPSPYPGRPWEKLGADLFVLGGKTYLLVISFMRNRKEKIKKNLDKKLGAEFLSVRQGCGGVKLTYVEGWVIISLANTIFGFDGWNSEVKDLNYVDQTISFSTTI
uniref:Uncharacterized protein n=1 Tax=Hippocampus comes TaxID=109280 RepID=A0A3Q2ZCJ6_HIPCM